MHLRAAAKAGVSLLPWALVLSVSFYFVTKFFGEGSSVAGAVFFGLFVALAEALLQRRRDRRKSGSV